MTARAHFEEPKGGWPEPARIERPSLGTMAAEVMSERKQATKEVDPAKRKLEMAMMFGGQIQFEEPPAEGEATPRRRPRMRDPEAPSGGFKRGEG